MVKIGHARYDENGNISGGKAGDNNGKEVCISDWYKHTKGWVLFRCIDSAKAKLIAKAMRMACENNNIGYDQSQRNTLYNAIKAFGFDTSKVTIQVETDCSALVRVCCEYAGISIPDFNTSTEANALMATKQFIKYTDSKYTTIPDYLQEGDILVTATKGHTVVVLTDGDKVVVIVSETKFATVNCKSLNCRENPNTSAKVLKVFNYGDKLSLTGNRQDRWYEIFWLMPDKSRIVGWCSVGDKGDYLVFD